MCKMKERFFGDRGIWVRNNQVKGSDGKVDASKRGASETRKREGPGSPCLLEVRYARLPFFNFPRPV